MFENWFIGLIRWKEWKVDIQTMQYSWHEVYDCGFPQHYTVSRMLEIINRANENKECFECKDFEYQIKGFNTWSKVIPKNVNQNKKGKPISMVSYDYSSGKTAKELGYCSSVFGWKDVYSDSGV